MTTGTDISTYFQGNWHDGDALVMRAADHGAWLGTSVFDGARFVDGMAPDLDRHCARLNASARSLGITPTHSTDEIVGLIWDGLRRYPRQAALYIRPMYWAIDGGHLAIVNRDDPTGFCISLEAIPMAPPDRCARLTTTRFRRPVIEDNLVDAKAGCLYPNNARMLREALAKGYDNALVADALGNVAETASANIFMVRDDVVFTPIPNGTFLSGITRARHIANLRADGVEVVEAVLTFRDFRAADEVFMTGNLNKVTSVSEFDGTHYPGTRIADRARALYWDWASSARGRP